ncbi:hypothetical protein V8G57_15500 [Collimonas sp. H4R21]|uniref:Uncharacterized protein n=1 Tax=Collimonas rhizosphaerae TaxID=3126357 RepID=A0ABU9PXR2_9BURK
MELVKIVEKLNAKVSIANLYQRSVKDTVEKELAAIERYVKSLDEAGILNHGERRDNMAFLTAEEGEWKTYGYFTSTNDDRRRQFILHKNKQYQWFLVNVFEAFEAYLKDIYAFAGYVDNNLWPLADFGNISLDELPGQKFDWFLKRSKAKKGSFPENILNQLRLKFPRIAKVESENHFGINLKLIVFFVEHLRHAIVHTDGVVQNKQNFIDSMFEKSGLSFSDEKKNYHVKFLLNFFDTGEHENTISLIENHLVDTGSGMHWNRLNALTDFIMAYADVIAKTLDAHAQPLQLSKHRSTP